ncbi:anion permease [Candidatus Nanosalina sp. VS9-1]|uniref:inorganic phosphate transporter n=1 Tax=Candidatus Nanosalina sp. VS9-1 TaxID=3388566 RepID=UPI0039E1E10E
MQELLYVSALAASVFMGISIGASTVASAFGPVNSARSANVLRAAFLAGFFAFIGALTQGAKVTETVGSGIIGGEIATVQAALILFIAALLVIVSVLGDYPMPTAFTVIGAVIGSGIAFGNPLRYQGIFKVIGYWILIPFLAVGLSFAIAKLLRRYVSKENSERKIKILLLVTGCYVAYSAGASAVGLAVGPLTGLIPSTGALLLMGGLSILMGAWLYSPRIIRAISFDYSNIGPRRSVAALGTAAILAQIGIFFGIPISFNEAVIASVIGSGLVEGKSNADTGKISRTVLAWTGAFFLSMALTAGAGFLILGL